MSNVIRAVLCGAFPPCGTGIPLFAPAAESVEKAMDKLGWKYERVYFMQMFAAFEEYANKVITYYRNAGVKEDYITVTSTDGLDKCKIVKISNNGYDDDSQQLQLIRTLWFNKQRPRGMRTLVYSSIPLSEDEGARFCDVRLDEGRISVYVNVSDGYGRETAFRVAQKLADEVGMKISRKMSKSRMCEASVYMDFPHHCTSLPVSNN